MPEREVLFNPTLLRDALPRAARYRPDPPMTGTVDTCDASPTPLRWSKVVAIELFGVGVWSDRFGEFVECGSDS